MVVRVEIERTDDMPRWLSSVRERCAACDCTTRFWHRATNQPLCQQCAQKVSADNMRELRKRFS